MTLDEATATLREVPCPLCLSLGSLAIMVCGPGWGDCQSMGQCSRCGYTFDVEFAAATLERLKQDAHVMERIDPCPACGAHQPEIHFACDTKAHGCYFIATCRACGRAFRIPVRTEDSRPTRAVR